MMYAMQFQGATVLVNDVRIDHGVLFANIIAKQDEHKGYFQKCECIPIITSNTFELMGYDNIKIYESDEEFEKDMENFFEDYL